MSRLTYCLGKQCTIGILTQNNERASRTNPDAIQPRFVYRVVGVFAVLTQATNNYAATDK